MADNSESDSDVDFPLSRKRKLGAISVRENDGLESDDDDEDDDDDDDDGEDMDSEGDDEEDESDGDESGDDDDDVVNDVDLADDVNSDQCAICLMEFTDQLLGVPDSCEHVFCSVCLQEWSKNINTCPVDRKVFLVIGTRQTRDGPQIDQIKVEDRTSIKEEYEDPTCCEVCGIGDREESMLLCDGCDRGFHLECLAPPLDRVPDGEWFCQDCFSLNSPSGAVIIDEEMSSIPPELEHVSDDRTLRSRPSTSRPRRARTVATTRRRRRTRGQTRTRGTRRRAQTARSSSKQGSSSRGASTSATRGKRKSKKKRRRRKKKRKSRKAKDKPPASRYLLLHEMEPSASFSIFGNDFSLECLPGVEPPAPIATPKAESQRSFPTSNPDVLGSIFSGLDTLHNKDLSVDTKGRVKVSKEPEDNPSSKPLADVSSAPFIQGHLPDAKNANASYKERKPSTSPSSGNGVSNKKDEQDMQDQHVNVVVKRANRFSPDSGNRKDNTFGASERSPGIPSINEKRIKRFDVIDSVRQCSVSTKKVSEGGERRSTPEPMKKSKTTDYSQSSDVAKYSKYDKTSYTTKTADTKTASASISTYRIPRKNPIPSSKFLEEASKLGNPNIEVKKESKFKEINVKIKRSSGYKDVGFSQPSKSVMDLLSRVSSQQRAAEGRTEESKNTTSVKRTCHDSTSVSSPNVRDTTPGIGSVNRTVQFCVPDIKVQENTLRVQQNTPSSLMVDQSEKTILSSAKSGDGIKSAKNAAPKSYNSSSDLAKIIQECSKPSGLPSSSRQTATNREIINMIKRKKSTLSDNDSDNTDGPTSESALRVKESTRHEKGFLKPLVTRKSQVTMLPPLCSVEIPSHFVAVVRPTTTTQGSSVIAREASNKDDDVARRRIEGIVRLQRNQKISDEVSEALKPFYRYKEITKEQYKQIYKRAMEKIKQSSRPVESRGVSTLVRNYVKKVIGNQMNLNAAT